MAQTPADSKVSCKYGAPMGRGSSPLGSGKVHLARVRLDSGPHAETRRPLASRLRHLLGHWFNLLHTEGRRAALHRNG